MTIKLPIIFATVVAALAIPTFAGDASMDAGAASEVSDTMAPEAVPEAMSSKKMHRHKRHYKHRRHHSRGPSRADRVPYDYRYGQGCKEEKPSGCHSSCH